MTSDPALIVYPEVVAFGGEERVLLTLVEHLHEAGIPFRVACYRDRVGLAKHCDVPLSIEEIAPAAKGFVGKARALAACLHRHRSSRRRPLLFGLQTASHVGALDATGYAVRIADTPSLLSPPVGRVAAAKSSIVNRFAGRGLRRADVCIANARYIGDEMRARFGVDAVTAYVPGKAPSASASRSPELSRPRLLSVSRLEGSKRIDWLIDAVAALSDLRTSRGQPPVELDIVGDGPLAGDLQARAASRAADLIHFHGFVDDAALERLYGGATLFAMPARQGFGLPAIEALYRGLSVVQHVESGVSEILRDTSWVELFDGGAAALGEAIDRLLTRIESGRDLGPRPWLPTRDSFGAAIVDICGWSANTSGGV